MTFAIIIGALTAIMSVLTKIIGFPDQVVKIHRRQSVEGLSTTFFVMTFVSYVLWTLHGCIQQDWVVIAGMGLGVVTSGVIVGQILYFKIKRRSKKDAYPHPCHQDSRLSE